LSFLIWSAVVAFLPNKPNLTTSFYFFGYNFSGGAANIPDLLTYIKKGVKNFSVYGILLYSLSQTKKLPFL
jgi:hypothetical protein